MSEKNVIGIIPARYDSIRLKGKPLADILGKPMVYHVYTQAKKSKLLNDVIVATDDERIKNAVLSFGGNAVMTSKNHQSGTDRITEVAEKLNADIVLNIQGDEPLIHPDAIDAAIKPLLDDETIYASTPIKRITDESDFNNPNVVKVVIDHNYFAIYFSRSLIPYPRRSDNFFAYKHLGLYVYRKDFLLKFHKLAPSRLETIESLEQLRLLENGFKIKTVETDHDSIGVDTQDDLLKIIDIMKKRNYGI